jgi:hypothetical protein
MSLAPQRAPESHIREASSKEAKPLSQPFTLDLPIAAAVHP